MSQEGLSITFRISGSSKNSKILKASFIPETSIQKVHLNPGQLKPNDTFQVITRWKFNYIKLFICYSIAINHKSWETNYIKFIRFRKARTKFLKVGPNFLVFSVF